jgi:lysine 6-dehydrogenase
MLARMRIAVLGAGAMGSAAARLLARHPEVDLLVLDTEAERAEGTVAAAGRGEGRGVDVAAGGLADALRGSRALASCIPYRLNLQVMEAALDARVPYADLGGLYHTTLRQLELDDRFREAGIPAILGIGCCPGTSNVLARLAADRLDEVHTIDIFDGAAEPGLGFGVPYSAETILDEFTFPAMVFEGGELKEAPAGSGAIPYRFPEPVGELEAVYTLHSEIATLPRTIPGVRDVRWRLALPPEVAGGFRTLAELGLASEEPVDTPSGPVIPRDLLRTVLARLPAREGPPEDTEALVVEATGPLRGRPAAFVGTVLLRPTHEGIDAGAFGTAIPIATATRWLAEGRVPSGVHPPETALPATEFLADLAGEGAEITVSVSESLGPAEAGPA